MMSVPFYLFITIELMFVAYLDFKYKKIKNIWSLINIIVAIGLFIALPEQYPLDIKSFQYTIVFILVGFMLFMLKIMGGGDSKFLATFFLLIPLKMHDLIFYHLLIVTVIIGLGVLLKNTVSNFSQIWKSFKLRDIEGVKKCFGSKFAYAPVILFTWISIGVKIFF